MDDTLTTRIERELWFVAVTFAMLDVATTYYGLQVGLSEANTLILPLFHSIGVIPAMVGAKLCAFGVAGLLRVRYLDEYAPLAPFCLAFVWAIVVAINVTMLLIVM